jgi:cytochrome c-type biogenesis protein
MNQLNLTGNPLDFLFAFLGGVLLSFTPCVYPLIPISVSYIGINSSGSKLKGLLLSLVYVSGVAVTYSILGLAASLSGSFFGSFSERPVVAVVTGVVIILFGLSMLDVITLPMRNFVKLPTLKKKNFFSIFFLGLVSGLMVSPCITPVLGSILTYLASKKQVVYGSLLLFCFAYGMGTVLILAGTFSTLLVNLPKSGNWLNVLKKFMAFILIGMGVYFVYTGIRRF